MASVSSSFTSNIFVVNSDGSGGDIAITKMTGASNSANSPDWSPDGTQIAYHSYRSLTATDLTTANGSTNINLWKADMDGNPQPVTRYTKPGISVIDPVDFD